MSKLQIYEILSKLKEFIGEGSVTKKVEWLRQHDSQTLRLILQHNFDPNIQYDLPEGEPPFKMNDKPIDYNETSLYSETRKISYLWVAPYDASLKNRVQAQTEAIERELQQLGNEATERDTLADEMIQNQKLYEAASREHDTHLTVLADLEAKIHLAKKNVDTSRVTMAQTKARLSNLTQRKQVHDQRIAQHDATLERMNKIHAEDKARLAKQPAAAPPIENRPTNPAMPRHRREMAFIQLLEALHPNEAKVILSVKNKTLSKQFPITKDIVKKAFPDIL